MLLILFSKKQSEGILIKCDNNLVEMFGLQNAAKITYEMTDLRNNPDYIRSDLGLG